MTPRKPGLELAGWRVVEWSGFGSAHSNYRVQHECGASLYGDETIEEMLNHVC